MSNVSRKCLHRVPKEFFCPISKEFMKDPVVAPSTKRTYNRKSVISLREGAIKIDNDNDILPPEDEIVLPDHDLRQKITAWRREYTLASPFSFISMPVHLETAVNSLLDRQEHRLDDEKLLLLLRELKSAIQSKTTIVNSRDGFLLLSRLIAGCPLDSITYSAQWLQLSVGMLANADNFNDELDLGVYQHQMLALLDGVSDYIQDAAFQLGLVNLIHSIMASKEQIINNSEIVRALSSYILSPSHGRFRRRKTHFDKLFYVILGLWGAEGALGHPRLSQAVASLVWPMHDNMDGAQYHHLLQTISSRLKSQLEDRTPPSSLPLPLEATTRAGLVSRIFRVLDYAMLPEAEKQRNRGGWLGRGQLTSPEAEEIVVMRCFEMLEFLSMVSIGRLEIVRVIRSSGYGHLVSFYSALSRNTLPRQKESHVLPALSMIFNILEHTRYTPLLETVRGPDYQVFLRLVDDDHAKVSTMANQIFNCYAKITREERDPPLQDY